MLEQNETQFANRTFADILTPKAPLLSPILSAEKLDEQTMRQELSPSTRGINKKIHFDLLRMSRNNYDLMERDRSVTPGPKSGAFDDSAL